LACPFFDESDNASILPKVRQVYYCPNMARMEQPHELLTPDTLITAIKAKVCFNDRIQAGALEESFDSIWDRLKQILAQTSLAK
jgi:hypothetical protein